MEKRAELKANIRGHLRSVRMDGVEDPFSMFQAGDTSKGMLLDIIADTIIREYTLVKNTK